MGFGGRGRTPAQEAAKDLKKALRLLNVDMATYENQLKKQKGRCAICRRLPGKGKPRLALDHDHKSNIFRGLLCGLCNRGLGFFQDSPPLLQKALGYLESKRGLDAK